MSGRKPPPRPSLDELRQAGVDAHLGRISAPLRDGLSATRRGRLAWRLACWWARRQR